MIFLILSILLSGFLLYLAMNVRTSRQSGEANLINIMINIMLFNFGTSVLLMFSLLSIFYGPEQLTTMLERLTLLGIACIYIEISLLFLTIARRKKTPVSFVFRGTLILFAILLIFTGIQIQDVDTFEFTAAPLFGSRIPVLQSITVYNFFIGFYIFALPLFSLLIMLLTGENLNSRITIHRAIFCFGALLFSWVGLFAIFYISNVNPLMRSLSMFIIVIMSVMIIESVMQGKIYDATMIFSSIVSMIVRYLIPALVSSIVYVSIRPIFESNPLGYFLIVFATVFLFIILGRALSNGFLKLVRYQSSKYEVDFEKGLAAIDYENETTNISQDFFKVFQASLQSSTMSLLIDSGTGDYITTFNSEGKNYTLPKNSNVQELLLTNEIYILFRSDVEANYLFQSIRDILSAVFEKTESEVLILLHEGHNILGLLLLGSKRTGSLYDEYDREIFNKFYSYFFVFGYYMKNIANASVVGTVNREIRMSSQIITSIQENMDPIKSPKIDLGYLMLPAHNIGGEFVDLIRLNDTSHIVVIGSLSGKGISASMSMVILKSVIRTFLADTHDFKELIQKINAFIRENLPKGTFFSGVFCLIDFTANIMYYINCGIPTMLMYAKAYNNVIEIQGKGYVLGFVKDVTPLVKVKQIALTAGDMLAISTNGLINSHSLRGEQFGKDRIKQSIMDNYTYPANRIARFTYDNLQSFMSKELEDDITLCVIRYFGNDTSMYTTDELTVAQEHIVDHSDVFDVDALLAEVISDSSEENALPITVESDEIVEPTPHVQEEQKDTTNSQNVPVADILDEETSTDRIIEESSDFDISNVFDDEMFNDNFSNPNNGISVADIADLDALDNKE